MTEPVRVGELLPGVLGEVIDRAGHGSARWAELVAQAGYCHHPIRLPARRWRAGPPCPLGEQLDVRNITAEDQAGGVVGRAGGRLPRQVRHQGHRELRRRPRPPRPVAGACGRACPGRLGAGRPGLEGLRLRARAHVLGFGGHWSTKSRRYSTTFTVLRRARVACASVAEPATVFPWTPSAGPRTTRPSSWSPPGPASARAMRLKGSDGWPCRPPLVLGNTAGSPGRS
jgi:hypothetical protein